jgi:hypothetical protein
LGSLGVRGGRWVGGVVLPFDVYKASRFTSSSVREHRERRIAGHWVGASEPCYCGDSSSWYIHFHVLSMELIEDRF